MGNTGSKVQTTVVNKPKKESGARTGSTMLLVHGLRNGPNPEERHATAFTADCWCNAPTELAEPRTRFGSRSSFVKCQKSNW